jgi:FtsP/CotA-like multicopper oxidase with cupredoxin domain
LNRTLIVVLLVLVGLGALFFVLRPGPAADASREETIVLAIEDGTMTPDEIEVGEGDRVTLRMTTSGAPTEVHLHGYDLEKEVAPGEPATLSFEADLTGRFEIEDHETGEVLGVLLVQPR